MPQTNRVLGGGLGAQRMYLQNWTYPVALSYRKPPPLPPAFGHWNFCTCAIVVRCVLDLSRSLGSCKRFLSLSVPVEGVGGLRRPRRLQGLRCRTRSNPRRERKEGLRDQLGFVFPSKSVSPPPQGPTQPRHALLREVRRLACSRMSKQFGLTGGPRAGYESHRGLYPLSGYDENNGGRGNKQIGSDFLAPFMKNRPHHHIRL